MACHGPAVILGEVIDGIEQDLVDKSDKRRHRLSLRYALKTLFLRRVQRVFHLFHPAEYGNAAAVVKD
jgi:hypothetical protein